MDTIVNKQFARDYLESLVAFCEDTEKENTFVELPIFSKTALAYDLPNSNKFLEVRQIDAPIFSFLPERQAPTVISNPRELYQRALEIIEEVWPEIYDIYSELITGFHKVENGRNEESYSDPKTFGLIYYLMDSDDELKWAEIMVHELSHHILFAATALEGFLPEDIDWAHEEYSAIRNEKRPLIGIYHGLIAQSFMLNLGLLVETNFVNLNSNRIFDFFGSKFLEDKQTIDKFLGDYLDPYFDNLISYVEKSIIKKGFAI